MKHLIIILTVILSSLSTMTAQNINDPFIGTWEWENGNETFRVELLLNEDDRVRGHFSMIETDSNGLETIIYKSNRDIGFGYTFGAVIYGGSDGSILEAGIDDNTVPNPLQLPAFSGSLKMIIQPINNNGQVTATWNVKRSSGLKSDADNRVFNIPTDIILTKVE